MTFYDEISKFDNIDFNRMLGETTDVQITRAINKPELQPPDFLALLSPKATGFLEQIAQSAHSVTLRISDAIFFSLSLFIWPITASITASTVVSMRTTTLHGVN